MADRECRRGSTLSKVKRPTCRDNEIRPHQEAQGHHRVMVGIPGWQKEVWLRAVKPTGEAACIPGNARLHLLPARPPRHRLTWEQRRAGCGASPAGRPQVRAPEGEEHEPALRVYERTKMRQRRRSTPRLTETDWNGRIIHIGYYILFNN